MAGTAPGPLPGPAVRIKEEFEANEESLDTEGSTSTLGCINPVYIKEEPNIKEEPEEHNQVHESAHVDTEQYCSNKGLDQHSSKEKPGIKEEVEEHNQVLESTHIDTGQNYSDAGLEHHPSSKDPSQKEVTSSTLNATKVPVRTVIHAPISIVQRYLRQTNRGNVATSAISSDDSSLPHSHKHPTETVSCGIPSIHTQLPANATDARCFPHLQTTSYRPEFSQGRRDILVDPSPLHIRKDKREEAIVPINPTDSDGDYSDDDDEYDESDDEQEILISDSDSDDDDIEVVGTLCPINSQHFTTEPPYKKLREAELVTLDYSDDSPDELPDGRFIPTTIWKRRKNSRVPQSLEALSFKHPCHSEGGNADGEISKETRGAIIALHYEGLSKGEVARWTGVTKPTVEKWVKYYEENGTTVDEYDLPIPKRSEENHQKGISTISLEQNKQSDTTQCRNNSETSIETQGANTTQGKNNNETSLETRGAIIALHHFGLTNAEVARRTGVTKPTVANWIKRYKTTGTTVDQPRVGRPRCTTAEQDEAIAAAIEANPFSSALEIQKQLNIPCALQTIRNRLLAKQRQDAAQKQQQNKQATEQ